LITNFISQMKIFIDRKTGRQFIYFCIIGGINTALDFGVYILLTRSSSFFKEYFFIANIISFSIAVTNSYILNRRYTFKSNNGNIRSEYTKFIIVNIFGVIFNTLILVFMVDTFGIHDLIAKAIAVGVVLFWNFYMNRRWTFKNNQ